MTILAPLSIASLEYLSASFGFFEKDMKA